MFIHILLVLMEYMELSVIQSLLESTPSHACELMETSNCHSSPADMCIFEGNRALREEITKFCT